MRHVFDASLVESPLMIGLWFQAFCILPTKAAKPSSEQKTQKYIPDRIGWQSMERRWRSMLQESSA